MKTARIDVGFRVGPTTNTIKVVYPTGGALVDITLTAGLYLTADLLAAQINTQLQAYNANLECAFEPTTRAYVIRSGALNFDIQFSQPTLRAFLGVALGTTYMDITSMEPVTPGVFVSALPWHSDTLTIVHSRKTSARPHNRSTALSLTSWYEFGVTAVLQSTELAAFRAVLTYGLRGLPLTVYYDSSVTTAWSFSSWWGYRTCVFTPESAAYADGWLTRPHQTVMEVPLELREWTASETSAATFAGTIAHAEVGVRFYAKIGGIGDIYLDGETPVGPLGAAWSAPVSKTVATYTYRPYMLDVSAGIKDLGAEISRRTGSTVPGSLTLTLADNRASYLRGLFARDKASGHVATLTSTLAYDTAGTGSTVNVDTTSGWASIGPAYLGRETLWYDGTTGTTLDATNAGGGRRDVFSLGSEDITYRHNANKAKQPRLIADYPLTWHGRHVRLFAFLVDQDGRALDSAIDSTSGYTREVYRGIVQSDPAVDETWRSWRIETKSIDCILQTEIGQEPVTGLLMQVPGDKAANNDGIAGSMIGPEPIYFAFFLTDNTRWLDMEVTDWLNATDAAADTAPTTTHYHLEVGAAGASLTKGDLITSINVIMGHVSTGASPVGTPMGDYTSLSLWFGPANGGYEFHAWQAGTRVSRITYKFGMAGSIGPLINFSGTVVTNFISSAPSGDAVTKTDDIDTAVYVGASDTVIPFWYTETKGVQPDQAAASGYARLGDEFIYYTAVSAFTLCDGMYQMTGCLRGRMGTTPTEHRISLGVDHKPQSEAVKITFGVGIEATGFLTAALRLAISTGGAHHGTYDTLAAKVGPGLCQHHFDTAAIAKVENGLPEAWRKVSCFISKPIKLADLLSQWLAPLNLYLTARTGATGLYRITVDEVVPPLESEPSSTTLAQSQLDAERPAEWKSGNDLIINRIKASGYRWDILKDAPAEGADVIATDEDSEYDYGIRGSLDWTLRGYNWDVGQATTNLYNVAAGVFARYGRPYDVLTLRTDRSGWLLKPGDHVSLTVPEAPDPDGTAGIAGRLAVVLRVAPTYWDPGGAVGAEVTVIVERYVRHSTYCPAAKVSTCVGTTLTLVAASYTDADHTDAEWFDNGDVVRIFNQGDASTVDVRTLSAKSGNQFTISSGLVNCAPIGANTRMVATTYGAVQALQRAHVFQASNATPPVLAVANTTAFKYT